MTTTTAKFETGKTYYTTWNEDTGREHMSRYTIQKRTAKTVVINGYRCKIHYLEYSNSEAVRFSRGTWILAKNVYNEEAQATQNARDIAWLEIEREIRERAAELKAIEAERNEVLSTPTVTTEAQEVAIDAEISAATATDAPKIAEVRIGDDIITYENGKCASVQSLKYGGLIAFENGETRWFTNPKRDNGGFYFDDLDQWDEGDFILEMIVRGACYHWDEEERFRPFLEAMGRGACTIDEPEPPVDDFAAKLAELQSKRDAAQAALLRAQEEHESAENTLQKFLSDTAGNLATKLQSLKLDYSIKFVTGSGYSFTATDLSNIYVDPFGDGKMFAFTDWRRRRYASYDTPTQVEQVIDMLREAIERGGKEFKFPTVDELTTTSKAA